MAIPRDSHILHLIIQFAEMNMDQFMQWVENTFGEDAAADINAFELLNELEEFHDSVHGIIAREAKEALSK